MDRFNSLFDSQFIYALGWTIVHSFWQSLLVFMLLSFSLLISKRSRPENRYWLSVAALICCLLISIKTFIYCYQDVVQASQLFAQLQNTLQTPHMQNWWVTTFKTINPWLDTIVLLWCIGFIVQGIRYAYDIALTQKLKNNSVSSLPNEWNKRLQGLVQKLGVTKQVSFLHSTKVDVPSVIGHFKPIILLPLGILTQLPIAQIEAIVLHELAHVKRHDYLINILLCLVKVLFFFNPFVLAINKKIDIERENSCDDIAVKVCGDPIVFANSLSQFAAFTPASQSVMAANKYLLLSRVTRLFSKHRKLSSGYERLIALGCITLFGLTLNVKASYLPPSSSEQHTNFQEAQTNSNVENGLSTFEPNIVELNEYTTQPKVEISLIKSGIKNDNQVSSATTMTQPNIAYPNSVEETNASNSDIRQKISKPFPVNKKHTPAPVELNTAALNYTSNISGDTTDGKTSIAELAINVVDKKEPTKDFSTSHKPTYVQVKATNKDTLVLKSATEIKDKKHIVFTPVTTEELVFSSADRKWQKVSIPYLSELTHRPNNTVELSKDDTSEATKVNLDPAKTLIAQINITNIQVIPGYGGSLTHSRIQNNSDLYSKPPHTDPAESRRRSQMQYNNTPGLQPPIYVATQPKSNSRKFKERLFSRFEVTAKVTILLVQADTYKFAGYGEKLISLHPKNSDHDKLVALRDSPSDNSSRKSGIPIYIIKNTWDILLDNIQNEILETISSIQADKTELIPIDTEVTSDVAIDNINPQIADIFGKTNHLQFLHLGESNQTNPSLELTIPKLSAANQMAK